MIRIFLRWGVKAFVAFATQFQVQTICRRIRHILILVTDSCFVVIPFSNQLTLYCDYFDSGSEHSLREPVNEHTLMSMPNIFPGP